MAEVTIHEYDRLNILAKKGQQMRLVLTVGDGSVDHTAKDAYMCVTQPDDFTVKLREWTKTSGEAVPGIGTITLDVDEAGMDLPTRPLPFFLKLVNAGVDEAVVEGFLIIEKTPGQG